MQMKKTLIKTQCEHVTLSEDATVGVWSDALTSTVWGIREIIPNLSVIKKQLGITVHDANKKLIFFFYLCLDKRYSTNGHVCLLPWLRGTMGPV